jgi:hypothetical protein
VRELFIYYRSPSSQGPALAAALRAMQSHLSRHHAGLEARFLRRTMDTDDGMTWMETYRMAPAAHGSGGVSLALQAEIEELAAKRLTGLIDGARHSEVFQACV